MNPGIRLWNDARCMEAMAILRQHKDLGSALSALSSAFGFPVTFSSLDSALRRYNRSRVSAHLGVDARAEEAAVSADPLDRDTLIDIPIAQTFELPDDSETTASLLTESSPPPRPKTVEDDLHDFKRKEHLAELETTKKRLLKELSDAREQIEILKELRAARPLPPIEEVHRVGATQRQGVPVMLCSDWHIEEHVDPRTVNGLNEYNLDIADRCVDRMAGAFEWMLRDPRYDCRAGVVWLGGDLFSGYIHEELAEGNFLSPVQATLWLQERLELMLRKIAATTNLERIIVPCNDGNHGRLTHKIRVATRTANSLEWLLYQTLAARLSDDPRFEFHIADGEWTYLDIFNKTLAFTHGDSFRYQGGVGGISIPLRRGANEVRKLRHVDYISLGHFHQRSDFGDIIVNGSMIGISPYSIRIHAAPEVRQQTWYMIDSRRGKSLSAPIWL